MDHGAGRSRARCSVDAQGRRLSTARVPHLRRPPDRFVTRVPWPLRDRLPVARPREANKHSRTGFHRRRPAAHRFGTRHLPSGELGGARDIRPVRCRLHGPSRADSNPHARRLGRAPAAARLPGRRRGRGVLRRTREVADRPRGRMIESPSPGVTVTRTGEQGAFGGELLTVNFGPHHPSTHGVLRLIVDLDGEQIKRVVPVIGYLHTGIEKQMEALRWQQGVVVTDRHDYLSPPINNLAYALAVERLMGVEVPPRAQVLRVIMSELTRLASHLGWRGPSGLTPEDAKVLGATGPMVRGSGVAWDLRKSIPYSGYENYDFDIAVSNDCDCYGRYLVRIKEMREAVKILRQALDRLADGPVNVDDRKMLPPPREELETSMEAVIHHFKLFTEGYSVPPGDVYVAVESGRGENGCYIVSDGTHKPRRGKFRSAAFVNLQALERMSLNHMIADMVAIIGTADTVLGDVDR